MRRQGRQRKVATGALALLVIPAAAFFGAHGGRAAAALDVNNAGVFELDGNVCNDAGSAPPWDWANQNCTGSATSTVGLFNSDYSQALTPGSSAPLNGGTATLNASTLCDDAVATSSCLQGQTTAGASVNDLAFVTGASKDPINPDGNWSCTTKPVTPKDEIDNAAAALYIAPVTDPATGVKSNHVLLYQDIERGVVNGTSNAGFWVFQNAVGCTPGSTGTGTFTGNHKNGDILLFATFNSGGSSATIQAFAWEGVTPTSVGSLNTAPTVTGTSCSTSTALTCGTVNTANVVTPWGPHNSAASAILPNGFFEVGIDLTDFYSRLNSTPINSTTVPCFSNFLADTRSSGSQGNAVNSDLHDYLGGNFSSCTPHLHTTPSATAIPLGSSVTDSATITGTTGFSAPTGSVAFYACGPLSGAPSTNGPNCTTSGTSLGSATISNGSAGPSNSFKPTATGTYCFLGVYSGDSNYPSVSDSASTECFVVRTSSTRTTPSSTSIPLGSSITDTANVTVSPSGGPAPTGTVSFWVCGPTTTATACTKTASNATVLNDGSGPTPPAAVTLSGGSATSASFTPQAVGTYCFLAVYSGDSNYPSSSDNDITRECFKVQTDTTTTTPSASAIKLGDSITDTATIAINPSGGPAPTGTVSFYVCGPFTTATACTSSATGYTVLNHGAGPNPPAAVTVSNSSATSSSFTPNAIGIYCFLAVYSGDSNYPSSQDNDSSRECTVVRSSTTVTVPSPGSDGQITLGQSVTDTATVTGNPSGGPAPTGTVAFYVCGPTPADTACLSTATNVTVLNSGAGPTPPAAVTLSGGTATSSSFTPSTAGHYCFLAVYSGDGNYPGSQDNDITRECFNANPAPSPLASTVSLDDTVQITGTPVAGNPNGDMTFTLYGPFTSQASITCDSNHRAHDPIVVSHTSEQIVNGNGYWNANVDVPLTNGTTGSNLWYAWGASFAPTNSNYLSSTLACSAEEVNVQYDTTNATSGSGFSLPLGVVPM